LPDPGSCHIGYQAFVTESSEIEPANPERQTKQWLQELSTGSPEPLIYRRNLEIQSLQNTEKRFLHTEYDIGFPLFG
jgi:hypothetical protein